MSISRRELLKLGTGTAAMFLAGTKPLSAMANWAGERIPIGLQLYSVRQDCEKDLASVLQAVAKMGYEGVEFAGYYNRNATELHELLQKHGLKCCGTHISLDTLKGDELKKTVEFNKTIENQYLIVSWMPETYAESLESVKEAAKVFNDIAAQLKDHDMCRRLPCARWRLQEDRRRIRLGPVLCQHARRRRRCKWTSGTASTQVAIRLPRSNDSRAAPGRSISKNPAVPTRPWSARATSTGRKYSRFARRPAARSGTSSSTNGLPARRWAT